MHQSDALDAPSVEPLTSARDGRWHQEYVAFNHLLPELLKAHRDRFVAIHRGVVVGVADSFKDAVLEGYKRVGYVPLHVGWVSETPLSPVRLPSPRFEIGPVNRSTCRGL